MSPGSRHRMPSWVTEQHPVSENTSKLKTKRNWVRSGWKKHRRRLANGTTGFLSGRTARLQTTCKRPYETLCLGSTSDATWLASSCFKSSGSGHCNDNKGTRTKPGRSNGENNYMCEFLWHSLQTRERRYHFQIRQLLKPISSVTSWENRKD